MLGNMSKDHTMPPYQSVARDESLRSPSIRKLSSPNRYVTPRLYTMNLPPYKKNVMLAAGLRLGKLIRRYGVRTTATYMSRALLEKYTEGRLGIHTEGCVPLSELDVDQNSNLHGYQPVDYFMLRHALRSVDVASGRDVFLDYGSGLGRAAIYAATYPFQRTIGVELSPQLHSAAEANLKRARHRLKCQVEFVCADATKWPIPSDVNVMFLYNPFRGAVLHSVLANILESFTAFPRHLRIIYRRPNWLDDELVQRGFRLVCKLPFFVYLPETADQEIEGGSAGLYELTP